MAFSKLAQTYANLGYDGEAEVGAEGSGFEHGYPSRSICWRQFTPKITRNLPAAIKAYENLAKASPENADVQAALADLYEQYGDFAKATAYNQKI